MSRRWIALMMVAGMLSGCDEGSSSSESDTDAPEQEVSQSSLTYHRDLKPIIDAHCGGCHQEGGLGPYPFESYEQVASLAPFIAEVTGARTMPPFPAAPAVRPYLYDTSLSDAQIAMFAEWASAGAPMGDPAQEGASIVLDQGLLDRVDASLQMDAAFTPSQTPDHYRCFVLDWPYAQDRYVTGFNVRADNVPIVHHAVIYLVDAENATVIDAADGADGEPGYPCYGSASPEGGASIPTRQFGGWAPGSLGTTYPEGTGVQVSVGARVVLQMHYNTVGQSEPQTDRSAVEFRVEESVEKDGGTLPWLDWSWPTTPGSMIIPPDAVGVIHSYEDDPLTAILASLFIPDVNVSEGIRLHSVYPHMHQLGRSIEASVVRGNGDVVEVVRISDWDFHWQRDYVFETPIDILPGDRLRVSCEFDNSVSNQPMINGVIGEPVQVDFGEGSYDEMCVAAFYVTALAEGPASSVDCDAIGSTLADETQLMLRFDADNNVRNSNNLEGELIGPVYGSVFRSEDVGVFGPKEGVEAVSSLQLAEVDIRGGESAAVAFDPPLPAGSYQILGFMDTDGNADPGAPDPDQYDPVMIPGMDIVLGCAEQTATLRFSLLLP